MSKNILVVDDHLTSRKIFKKYLMKSGIPVDSIFLAENGVEALEIAGKVDIGLFLTDWRMPKMDGLNFIINLKKINKYVKSPIIVITSQDDDVNKIMKDLSKGSYSVEYLRKPIEIDLFQDKIDKYLGDLKWAKYW